MFDFDRRRLFIILGIMVLVNVLLGGRSLESIIFALPGVIVAMTFHEFAHAYAAYKCGDSTAKFAGRMTLNPLKHFDLWGIVMFAIAGFGWAQPVPINPNNFENYRKGCFWTSIAGVLMNYCMAFVLYPLYLVIAIYLCPLVAGTYLEIFLKYLFWGMFSCSLSFCVFNLLPLYPLDGFRVVDAVNTTRGKVYQFLRQYGYYILLGLILVHAFSDTIPFLAYVDVLGYVLTFAVEFFGRPITLLWDWIFSLIVH